MKKIRIYDITIILSGTFLLAAVLYHLHFQNNLTEGGFIGLAFLFQNFFHVSPSLVTLLLDIPFVILGYRYLGKKMMFHTCIGIFSFSFFYSIMEKYSPFTIDLSNHLWVASIAGGVLVGIGLGMILKVGAATGGDEIASLLMSKLYKLSIGKIFFTFDSIVLLLSLTYLDWENISYTLLSVFICSKMTDFIYYR